ncbi:hypothetical protein ACLOAU_08320 [Niabella sp. CJ426]|uniref:FEKKY domain-containing protein n=1 Tax=Niabella sp. CJ426 TaxID=3393740 RepID=UPI003CFE37E7
MNRLLLIVLITGLPATVCFSQTKATKSTLRLLTYGLPNFQKQNAENVVSDKWGIEFYAVAGCDVSKELQDSAEQHNKIIEPLIEKKYGKNWQEKFNREVDAEFELEKKVIAVVDKLDYIEKRQAEMAKEGNGLHYIMTPIRNSTKYNVSVQGWGKWNDNDEWVTYYQLLVDYKTKVVKLASDKIMLPRIHE